MKKAARLLSTMLLLFSTANFSIAGEKVNESIDLGGSRQATWYLPDGPAQGWVLLQHGFQRNKSNLDDLATHLMDNGLLVLTVNASVTGGNASLARDFADDLVDNSITPPNGVALPEKMVLAGHSAGGLFVSYMSGRLVERSFPNLQGVMLYDPVDKDDGMEANLQSAINSGSKVLSILANSSSCNSSNNALQPLTNLSEPFVGIKLTNNSKHTDVEGSSTGGIITWVCGTPKDYNVAYLKEFSTAWIKDMISGTVSSSYYPGGDSLNQLLDEDDGVLIKEIIGDPPIADFSYGVSQLSVNFVDESNDPDGSIVSYQWQFGDGAESTVQNPSHTFAQSGTYTVTLLVEDNNGQTGTISKNVTVSAGPQNPIASFTYASTQLEASFNDSSSDSDGEIVSWAWSFGDGATSSSQNPVYLYSQPGDYQVTLKVTDDDGLTDETSMMVSVSIDDGFLDNGEVINDLSAAQGEELHYKIQVPQGASNLNFSISSGSGDADLYVRYNAAPTTSQYDYRPYKNGNNETVEVSNPQGGVWYLMLRGYSSFSGVTLTVSFTTQDNQAPNAAFTYTSNGLTINFTDASTDVDGTIDGRLWTFGDGSQSQDTNPSHTFAQAGTYNVTLAVTDNDNASNQTTQIITVSETDGPDEIHNGETISGLSASTGEEIHYVLKGVPPATVELQFLIEGGTGDADIYVRYGAKPTTSEYDYRPYRNGNYEPVNIPEPTAGDWYVMVRAYSSFSGVSLSASHTVN
ncbi:PKD domain-containing protein [Aliikangiella sp. G2MR2-5]|uniref:PKD domain-containing protein n=1 Tax=Aliikangiella sp. G2MR2-5 TaxID=2788943 RepID=UPI0018AB9EB6|nr:PKD domain-containing protein [Aliikangiella sp. G2MR2-5]